MYSEYGITFHGTGAWNFGNDYAKNFVTFGVDCSLSHTDNLQNNILVLGAVPTYGINGRFRSPEKKENVYY